MRLTVVGPILLMALLAPAWGPPAAGAQSACLRGSLTFTSWRIPGTDGRSGWRPLAVDGSRVVMVRGPGDLAARPGPLTMALLTAGSARYAPLLPGSYPHAGVLQRWQLSWPWLVGTFNLQSPPTLGWTLWAGNVLTGKHLILDEGHEIGRSGTGHAFPDFDLSGGRVVWSWTSFPLRVHGGLRSRIALFDLTTFRQTFVPIPVSARRYANPTISGNRIVWERYTDFPCTHAQCPHQLIDLQLYDLATHRLQTLTHSSFHTGNSFSPGLWGTDLVFQHGPQDAQGGGTVIMVHLASHVPGIRRFWWQRYRYRVLEPRRTGGLEVRDGLAVWDGGVADLASGQTMPLPFGEVQWLGGRSLVVQRIPPSGPAPYTLLRDIRPCA